MLVGGVAVIVSSNDENLWINLVLKDAGKSKDGICHKGHPHGFRWLNGSLKLVSI